MSVCGAYFIAFRVTSLAFISLRLAVAPCILSMWRLLSTNEWLPKVKNWNHDADAVAEYEEEEQEEEEEEQQVEEEEEEETEEEEEEEEDEEVIQYFSIYKEPYVRTT